MLSGVENALPGERNCTLRGNEKKEKSMCKAIIIVWIKENKRIWKVLSVVNVLNA